MQCQCCAGVHWLGACRVGASFGGGGGRGNDVEAVFVCELKVENLAVVGGVALGYKVRVTACNKIKTEVT